MKHTSSLSSSSSSNSNSSTTTSSSLGDDTHNNNDNCVALCLSSSPPQSPRTGSPMVNECTKNDDDDIRVLHQKITSLSTALQHAQTRARHDRVVMKRFQHYLYYGLVKWLSRTSGGGTRSFDVVTEFAAPLILAQHEYALLPTPSAPLPPSLSFSRSVSSPSSSMSIHSPAVVDSQQTHQNHESMNLSESWQLPQFPVDGVGGDVDTGHKVQILSAYLEDVRASVDALPSNESLDGDTDEEENEEVSGHDTVQSQWLGILSYEQLLEGCVFLGVKLSELKDKLTKYEREDDEESELEKANATIEALREQCRQHELALEKVTAQLHMAQRDNILKTLYNFFNRGTMIYSAHVIVGLLILFSSWARRTWFWLWNKRYFNRLFFRRHRGTRTV